MAIGPLAIYSAFL